MARVLITGASGFLGGRLAQVLSQRGSKVRVLLRPGAELAHLRDSGVEFLCVAPGDVTTLNTAVQGITHIYNCAGCSTDWAPWSSYFEANVTIVRNLLDAAGKTNQVRRFLHVSTTDVYGYPAIACDETQPLTDAGLPYNSTKCLGEESVWAASREHGVPVTIVRPATIYGPRGKAFAADIAQLIRQRMMAVFDGGKARGGFCYVDNAVDGIIDAANAPEAESNAYNLADGTGVTWRKYVDALADGLGERRPWIDLPSSVALGLARVLESPHKLLRIPGRPLLTRHAVLLLSRDQEYPTAKAQRDFGFLPRISWDEGLRRTVGWLRQT
jgi:nucleoside-diphosphate-sugar epimerase